MGNEEETTEKTLCIICLTQARVELFHEDILHNDEELGVRLEYAFCDKCEREFVPADMIQRNEKVIAEAKEEFDQQANALTIYDADGEFCGDADTVSFEYEFAPSPPDTIMYIDQTQLNSSLTINGKGGEMLITLNLETGDMEFGDSYTTDEATRVFWNAIHQDAPEQLRKEIAELKEELAQGPAKGSIFTMDDIEAVWKEIYSDGFDVPLTRIKAALIMRNKIREPVSLGVSSRGVCEKSDVVWNSKIGKWDVSEETARLLKDGGWDEMDSMDDLHAASIEKVTCDYYIQTSEYAHMQMQVDELGASHEQWKKEYDCKFEDAIEDEASYMWFDQERGVGSVDVSKESKAITMPEDIKWIDKLNDQIDQLVYPTRRGYDPLSSQEDFIFPNPNAVRGSKVETLPGGSSLESSIEDLEYFKSKWREGAFKGQDTKKLEKQIALLEDSIDVCYFQSQPRDEADETPEETYKRAMKVVE